MRFGRHKYCRAILFFRKRRGNRVEFVRGIHDRWLKDANCSRRHAFVNQHPHAVIVLAGEGNPHFAESRGWLRGMRQPDFRRVAFAIELCCLHRPQWHGAAEHRDGLRFSERVFDDQPSPDAKEHHHPQDQPAAHRRDKRKPASAPPRNRPRVRLVIHLQSGACYLAPRKWSIRGTHATLCNPFSGGGCMRAVVTGGAGFLGSHLCDRLLAEGWEVLALDNFITGASGNLSHLKNNKKFRFQRADVSKPLKVAGKVSYVLHFASPASPPDYLKHPIATMMVGSVGTQNALELALAKKAKFFLASSSECYGDPEVSPQHEDYWGHVNPIGPRGVYDEAKRFSEAMTMAYHRYHEVDTHIVRIFNTYGPRMRLNDGRALPNFVFQALSGKPLTIYGDGKQTRSFCYVADLIEGIYRLMK